MKKKENSNIDILNSKIEYVLIGLMVILVCLIALLNNGPIGHFLTYISIYLFGAFYFVIYAGIILSSVYLMIKRKRLKVKHKMSFVGVILVFIACLICTSTNSTEIRFNNLIEVFNGRMATVSSRVLVIDSMSNLPVIGGGFIGYLFKALLNTCLGEIGTIVVSSILMALGLILLLKDVIVYIVKFFINAKWKDNKKTKDPVVEETNEEQNGVESLKELVKEQESDHVYTSYREEKVEEQAPIQIARMEVNELSFKEATPVTSSNEEVTREVPLGTTKEIENPTKQESSFIEELDLPKKEEKASTKDYFADDIDEDNNKVTEKVEREEIQISREIPNKNETLSEPKVEEEPKPRPIFNEVHEFKVKQEEPVLPQEEKSESKPKSSKKYILPSMDLLEYHPHEDTIAENQFVAEQRVEKINNTFTQFKVGARVVSYTIGPSVTRFNVKMNEGVRVNTLSGITNEISIALNGDKSVRLEMIVEGRDTSSIEVGNKRVTPVSYIECYEAVKDKNGPKDKLLIPLGKDIENHVVTTSLDELPHLLVAGTTGSGKSVFVNTIIATLIMKNTPDELKLMLVDPKKVEFTRYKDLPFLLCPIITEGREAAAALVKLCEEMDDRYAKLSLRGVSKISEYNQLAERKGFEKMCSIVLVIDEFADLLTNNSKEINANVQRLCQKARAAGIYLIICTQRPSVNVITGDIKAVIPSRIGLLVPSGVDSKTILDQQGAESLLGNGDMLCQIPHHSSLVRVQGAYISGVEIAEICEFIKNQRQVEYDPKFCNLIPHNEGNGQGAGRKLELDELHEEAKAHVIETRIASTSNLQSYFSIGYARADHILNCLEQEGIVKRASGNRRIVVAQNEDDEESNEE